MLHFFSRVLTQVHYDIFQYLSRPTGGQVFFFYIESMLPGHCCHLVVKVITAKNEMCIRDMRILCTQYNKIWAVRVLL